LVLLLPFAAAHAQTSNLKAWSREYNSTTAPPGNINTAYSMPAGSNRVLVVAIASTRTTAGTMTATASYGLQSMTPQISDATTSALQHTWIFTLDNAGIIAAGANDDLAVTVSGGTHQYSVVYAAVYSGVNQTTPVSNSRNFNSGDTANNQVGGFGSALTIATGDQAVEIVNLIRSANGDTTRTITGFAADWSVAAGPVTNPTNHAANGTRRTNAYLLLRSTTGSTTSQHTASSNNTLDSMSAITLLAAPIPPIITSAVTTTFNEGVAGSFQVTASGTAPISFGVTGTLPSGVSFDTGTGVLSGTPGIGTAGVYPLVFSATNGTPPNANQGFTLRIGNSPGEDGDQVFTSGTTVVNAYGRINSTASAGASSFSVQRSQISQLALPAAACPTNACNTALQVGDLLMIYQPQGAVMSTGDDTSYGDVTNYGSAGLYEFVYVNGPVPSAIGGATDVVTLNFSTNVSGVPCTGLRNTYEVSASAGVAPPMLIRVPQYRNLTVNLGASLVAAPWAWTSGSAGLGGVLALDVRDNSTGNTGTITLNGSLSASGRGFRGGTDLPTQSDTDNNSSAGYRNAPSASNPSADKGESIVGNITRYDSLSGRAGRGAPGNGGGAGTGHNGAGGGGSNAGSPAPGNANSYGGSLGVPDLTGAADPGNGFGYFQAWCLDPVIGNGTTSCGSLVQGSGGGRGGYTWSNFWAPSPFVSPPGDTTWGADASNRRFNFGGLGGRPLDAVAASSQRNQSYRRLFFGGGGGAGDANNGGGTGTGWAGAGCGATGGSDIGAPPNNGGNGGGLVFVIAGRIVGSGSIQANGAAGEPSCGVSGEGPAGGGGGGTVVVSTSSSASTIPVGMTVQAIGGEGGDQTNANTGRGADCAAAGTECEAQGGGGGGGGGVILAPAGGSKSVVGGDYGITLATSMEGIVSGAASGRFYPNGATSGVSGLSLPPPPRTGDSSPFTCLEGPGFSTPVSAAYFHAGAEASGDLRVRFATSAEVGNAGFRVVASDATGRELNSTALVPSRTGFGDTPQVYEVRLNAPADARLSLYDIDLQGHERRHGPYEVGTEYGELPTLEPYAWTQSRAELGQYLTSLRGGGALEGKLGMSERGMYRVSHAELLSAGIDLSGVPTREIALIGRHGGMPRLIEGGPIFGTDSAIVYHADVDATLWSQSSYMLLRRDASAVRNIASIQRPVVPSDVATFEVTLSHAPQTAYDPASPLGDPWYARRLLTQGTPVSMSATLSGPQPVNTQAELEVLLWGGIANDGEGQDHSARVLLNGQVVAQLRWDGITTQSLNIPVALSSGSNTVTIEASADTPYPIDIIYVESIRLRYRADARGDGAAFQGAAVSRSPNETIFADGAGDGVEVIAGQVTVDQVQGNGLRAFGIGVGEVTEASISSNGSSLALPSEALPDEGSLWIGSAAAFLTPQIQTLPDAADLLSGQADWLAISHGLFLPAMNALAAHRQGEGLSTKLVDVEAIYARYSAGNPDPYAIQRYISDAQRQLGVRYVVLAGADTVDAPGYLGSGSISFIPTPYLPTSRFVQYAPADAVLGDIDADGVADIPVGRLPVRTSSEAFDLVAKIIAYAQQPATDRLLLVAGPNDSGVNFAVDSETIDLGSGPTWQRGYVYQNALGLSAARSALVQAFDAGQSLVSYMGHSGPTRWTFDPLFTTSQVTGAHPNPALRLSPSENQPIVLQFACWTTYFVSAQQNSMAQILLNTPDRGASAVVGATVLMAQDSHRQMAEALAPLLQTGTRIGDAVLAAKQTIAADPDAAYKTEIQLAQVILGDPAQRIR
jgi:hypothetical protein